MNHDLEERIEALMNSFQESREPEARYDVFKAAKLFVGEFKGAEVTATVRDLGMELCRKLQGLKYLTMRREFEFDKELMIGVAQYTLMIYKVCLPEDLQSMFSVADLVAGYSEGAYDDLDVTSLPG